MSGDPGPPDPALAALYAAAGTPPDAPLAARAAVRARLVGTLGAAMTGAAVGAHGASVARRLLALVSSRGAIAVLAFATGAASGIGIYARLTARSDARSTHAAHAPASASALADAPAPPVAIVPRADAPALALETPRAPAPADAPVVVARAAPVRRTAAPPSDDLAAEASLIATARAALARGLAPSALAALARHAARFPAGQLAEDRTALEVQALVAAGRAADARATGARFRARYPRSLLRPAVDAALRSIP